MHDIEYPEPQPDGDLPDGAGMTLALLAGLAILPMILAALTSGKPLWMVLAIWALGGQAMTVALGFFALRMHDSDAGVACGSHDGDLRHV